MNFVPYHEVCDLSVEHSSCSGNSDFENRTAAGGESSKMVLDVETVHLALTSNKSDPVSDSNENSQIMWIPFRLSKSM